VRPPPEPVPPTRLARRLSAARLTCLLVVPGALACGAGEELTQTTTGSLEVTTVTSGDGTDADGYTITVDGVDEVRIAVVGQVILPEIEGGERNVVLGDVAENCRAVDEEARQVTVDPGLLSQVAFHVECSSLAGVFPLRVDVRTSGVGLDPDGYIVRIDPALEQPVATTDSSILQLTTSGPVLVRLAEVADNCTIGGDNPRTVDVPGETTYEVTCWPELEGRIAFVSTRSGSEGELLIRGADGVGLQVLASEAGSFLRSPSWSPDGARLVYERFSLDDASRCCVFISTATGTDIVPLIVEDTLFSSDHDHQGIFHPRFSPDGTRVLLVYHGAVYTIGIDGGELTRVVPEASSAASATWSPDGQRIAFAVHTRDSNSRPLDQNLYVVGVDGRGLTPLTEEPGIIFHRDPAWSPDGRWIAFASNREGGNPFDGNIFVIEPATGRVVNLTNQLAEYTGPAWSPDGFHLAFSLTSSIWIMNADGSGRRRLTDASEDFQPSWGR
jgi:hypothetical protein